MTPHERGQHWLFAIAFILLVLTGMPIKFADSDWAAGLVSVMGGLTTTRKLHRICGVLLIAMFLYHVGYMLTRLMRQRRQARAAGSRESIWSMLWRSPVVVTPFDVRQFGQHLRYLLFRRRERPAFGEMNFRQKFEYWAVFWASGDGPQRAGAVVCVVGVGVRFGPALNFAFIIHSDEAYLAFIYIAVVHMFSVVFSAGGGAAVARQPDGPGRRRRNWRGHRGVLDAVAAEFGVKADDLGPERKRGVAVNILRRGYSAVLLGGVAGSASSRSGS